MPSLLMVQTLVADPPWPFADSLPGPKRGAKSHYRLMTLQQIMDYPMPPLADDCRLFLWRVGSMQREALDVAKAWGFKDKAELIWLKRTVNGNRHFGMGHQVRNEHEACLIATRGKPKRLAHLRSTFEAPIGRHSAKPDEFYSIVEQLSPGPYCELFARDTRPGWLCLGDELYGNLTDHQVESEGWTSSTAAGTTAPLAP